MRMESSFNIIENDESLFLMKDKLLSKNFIFLSFNYL